MISNEKLGTYKESKKSQKLDNIYMHTCPGIAGVEGFLAPSSGKYEDRDNLLSR